MPKPDAYGEIVRGSIPSSHVDHVFGFRVGRGPAGEALGIDIHYRSDGNPKSLTMALGDALALLGMLKSFQLSEGLPFPDDPRDPTWRAGTHKADGSLK